LGRTAALKTQILSFWEAPSAALIAQVDELKAALPRAIGEANTLLNRARTVSQNLQPHGITLTVPPQVP
jgi:hypothetical protein